MAVKYNFNPGPSALPKEVLKKAENEMFNFKDSGLSVMEMSHRSTLYEEIHFEVISNIRNLLKVPENYKILLLQGGASLQFAMLPMNFLTPGKKGAYVLTGSWAEKAYKEAEYFGQTSVIASTKNTDYTTIPDSIGINSFRDTAYIHLTSNNTIYGTQWSSFPPRKEIPVFIDASSDIFSRFIDWENTDLVYAGAQKNAGPAGTVIVILRDSLLEKVNSTIPLILSYSTHVKADSLYNTPPTLSIYMMGLVLKWIDRQGGIAAMERAAREKAKVLYNAIDSSEGFYKGYAAPKARSLMNITFNLPSKQLEERFLQMASEEGFSGLPGHRSIGGCRASLYNSVPQSHVNTLSSFMKNFEHKVKN